MRSSINTHRANARTASDLTALAKDAAQVASAERNPAARAFRVVEHALDRVFGAGHNPLRQLGALGFYLFWIVVASGIYIYALFDTSIDGAYRSVQALTLDQPFSGGLMRSLHRYASDAFAVVVTLHLVRELAYGRFRGFRWYSWVSGVPLIWFVLAAGIGGYWLVWDRLAQFIGVGMTEWLGWLPGFGAAMVRNFLITDTLTDRLFSLLIFLHIGIPLLLLLGMWAHIQRIVRPRTSPDRRTGIVLLTAMLALCVAIPALSQAPADLATAPAELPLDWFYLFALPLMYLGSPGGLWFASLGATLLLLLLPIITPWRRPPPAAVDLANCNGCARCVADCPYDAVVMVPRSDGREHSRQAAVLPDLCASCGICAGACPSSTPFRSVERLQAGIDLPDRSVSQLREQLRLGLRQLERPGSVVVFRCEHAAEVRPAEQAGGAVVSLKCAGMLPPSFIEFALRGGANAVLIAVCADGDCEYGSGVELMRARLDGEREPHLRANVSRDRLRVVRTSSPGLLAKALSQLRAEVLSESARGQAGG